MTDPESRKRSSKRRSLADPGFKKLFSHPLMAELVVRRHVPKWEGRLDFSTLELGPTELITDRLAQRYADLAWRGVSKDGANDFLLMMEFQARPDPAMALRTAGYAALAARDFVESRLHRGESIRRLTVESLVFHHGTGRWTAPTRVKDLLEGSGLGGYYRIVSWRPAGAPDPERLDLPAMTLGLGGGWKRDDLPSEMQRLRRLVRRFGDENFDRFVARYAYAILNSRFILKQQLEEPITMETVVRAYTQEMEDWAREHQEEGERRGQAQMLRGLVARRFGSAAETELASVLATPMGLDRMSLLADAVLECDSSADFLARARELVAGG